MADAKNHNTGGIAADQLLSFIQRIERLEGEKSALTADITEVYNEAKGTGFDTKIMRQIVRERKKEANIRQEEQAILDLYRHALGMLDGTPLGEAALERATA